MRSSSLHLTLASLLICTAPIAALPQEFVLNLEDFTRSESLTELQVDKLLDQAIDRSFSAELTGVLVAILLKHEQVVLPRIVSRLKFALEDASKPGRTVTALEDLIAYAATPAATDALLDLEADYPSRVERLIPVLLSSSVGRRNSFELAYRALSRGGIHSRFAIGQWVNDRLLTDRYFAEFAEAFVNRHGSEYAAALTLDPLTSRLDGHKYFELRASIEAEVKRRKAGRER